MGTNCSIHPLIPQRLLEHSCGPGPAKGTGDGVVTKTDLIPDLREHPSNNSQYFFSTNSFQSVVFNV